MVESRFEIKGLDLVQANMRRVARGYPREQRNIHADLGQSILQRARTRVRVRTGRLRSSIHLRTTSEQVEVEAGQGLGYAGFQHWGTRHISSSLYLTEPLRELEGKLVSDYQKLTERYVDKVWIDNV